MKVNKRIKNLKDAVLNKVKSVKDFLLRNGALILIIVGMLWIMNASLPEFHTIFLIVTLEALALLLAGFAVWAFTTIDWIQEAIDGGDGKSVMERFAGAVVIAFIVLSVHILVGLTVFAVYLGQFANV